MTGQCEFNQCKRVDPVAPGQACQGTFDCGGGISCVNGFCTGGEDTCAADDNNGQTIGPSTDCTSGFCRAGQCSNVPAAVLGDVCDEDRDCSGFEDNTLYRSLLYCGQAASGSRRCGSGGAYCVAVDASLSGSAPALCVSGEWKRLDTVELGLNSACRQVNASATPAPKLLQLLACESVSTSRYNKSSRKDFARRDLSPARCIPRVTRYVLPHVPTNGILIPSRSASTC